jgi:hypothetical protein
MKKPKTEIRLQERKGKANRFPAEHLLLLFFWLLTSGFCLLLCNSLVTALCQSATPHG